MKKIFTLLFTTAMLSSAFAQYGQNDQWDQRDQRDQRGYDNNRDVVVNDGNHRYNKHNDIYRGGYYFTAREKDMQIAQINREFEYKMRTLRNQYYMGRYQKMRQIRFLEEKRDNEIHEVMHRFNDRRNQFNTDNRRHRKDW